MKPIEIPAADLEAAEVRDWFRVRFVGPEGSDIGALPAVVADSDEGEQVLTYWEPSPAERRAIAAGAPVMLQVLSRRMPAVALSVRRPE